MGINNTLYPFYFQITSEEVLPGNEVYSIIQDKKGFIWIGCDAGIYKYDGIRFIPYKSEKQQSKSLSGLCESARGRIYCYSFKGQVFYLKNDSLYELKHDFDRVSCINSDNDGNIWIGHFNGLSKYNEKKKQWNRYNSKAWTNKKDVENFIFNSSVNKDESVDFLCNSGIGTYRNGKFNLKKFDYEKYSLTAGNFFIENIKNEKWLFSFKDALVLKIVNRKIQENNSKKN